MDLLSSRLSALVPVQLILLYLVPRLYLLYIVLAPFSFHALKLLFAVTLHLILCLKFFLPALLNILFRLLASVLIMLLYLHKLVMVIMLLYLHTQRAIMTPRF